MSIAGRFDDFTLADIVAIGEIVPLPGGRAKQLLEEVVEAVSRWRQTATGIVIPEETIASIEATQQALAAESMSCLEV